MRNKGQTCFRAAAEADCSRCWKSYHADDDLANKIIFLHVMLIQPEKRMMRCYSVHKQLWGSAGGTQVCSDQGCRCMTEKSFGRTHRWIENVIWNGCTSSFPYSSSSSSSSQVATARLIILDSLCVCSSEFFPDDKRLRVRDDTTHNSMSCLVDKVVNAFTFLNDCVD